jgi:hypothetical protein
MIADRKTVAENYNLRGSIFTSEEVCAYPDMVELVKKLQGVRLAAVQLNSDAYCHQENLVKDFLLNARSYPTKSRETRLLQAKKCHENVAFLLKTQTHLRHIRGWALDCHGHDETGSGFWLGHSWAWDPVRLHIVETTSVDWLSYFGRDVTNQIAA